MRLLGLTLLIVVFSYLHPQQLVSPISVDNVQEITLLHQITFEESTFRDLIFSPNSENLLVSVRNRNTAEDLNGEVVLLSVDNFIEVNVSPHPIFANALAFSPDGTLFAVGTESGAVSVFDSRTFNPLTTIQAGEDIINDLSISQSNSFIAVTFAIPTIGINGSAAFRLISLDDGTEIFTYPLEADRYGGGVAFDEIGNDVFFSIADYSSDENNSLHTLNIATSSVQSIPNADCGRRPHLLFVPHLDALICTNDSIDLIYPFSDNHIDSVVRKYNERNEQIISLGLHPTEPILAVGYFVSSQVSDDNYSTIQLLNYETGAELVSLQTLEGIITNLAFSPDGTLLASGGADGTVRLWGIPTGEE